MKLENAYIIILILMFIKKNHRCLRYLIYFEQNSYLYNNIIFLIYRDL